MKKKPAGILLGIIVIDVAYGNINTAFHSYKVVIANKVHSALPLIEGAIFLSDILLQGLDTNNNNKQDKDPAPKFHLWINLIINFDCYKVVQNLLCTNSHEFEQIFKYHVSWITSTSWIMVSLL